MKTLKLVNPKISVLGIPANRNRGQGQPHFVCRPQLKGHMKPSLILPSMQLAALLLLGPANYAFSYYDPGAQRWISRDPMGELGAINLYTFVHNDAPNTIDLHGLWSLRDGWERLKLPVRMACGAMVAYVFSKVYFQKQSDDRYAHCMVSCRIAGLCGQDIANAAGVAKEFLDLATCAYQGLRTGKWDSPQCESALQPGDFQDNSQGIACPPNKTCGEQCKSLKDAPPSKPGPFYRLYE